MSRNILDIYTEYKIFPKLQQHMLRVASVVSLIVDSCDLLIDKEKIITTALVHDMGNIVKSRLELFRDFTPEELKYWQGVKEEVILKYGRDDHEANENITREIGLEEEMVRLIEENQFATLCKHAAEENWYAKIITYADGRSAPNGVMSYKERHEESWKRYKDEDPAFGEGSYQKNVACGLDIEKQIFEHCSIKPEDITDESIAPIMEELRHFMIK